MLVASDSADFATQGMDLVAAVIGFISLILLWVAVVLGFLLRSGGVPRMKPTTFVGLHQTVAVLALCLGVVHACVSIADPARGIRVIDAIVPFSSAVDPVGIGLGVLAIELFVAVALSMVVQRRIGYTRWRALHAMAYFAFMLVVGHVLVASQRSETSLVWGGLLIAWLVTVVMWVATLVQPGGPPRSRAVPGSDRSAGPPAEQDLVAMVDVDTRRCARFGFCEQIAPEVFVLRGGGRLAYRSKVEPNEIAAAVRAAQICPTRAIAIRQVAAAPLAPLAIGPAPFAAEPATTGEHIRRQIFLGGYSR